MDDWCGWCASHGKVHQRDCAVARDAGRDPACTCVPMLCPVCRGESAAQRERRAARFVENVTLLHRANRLLKAPLTPTDRGFLEDFVHRLINGATPRLTDYPRIKELERSYTDVTPLKIVLPEDD